MFVVTKQNYSAIKILNQKDKTTSSRFTYDLEIVLDCLLFLLVGNLTLNAFTANTLKQNKTKNGKTCHNIHLATFFDH